MTGVSIGPFRATRFARIESRVSAGSARPVRRRPRAHRTALPLDPHTGGPDHTPGCLDHLGTDAVAGDQGARWINGVLPCVRDRLGIEGALWSAAGPPTILSEARALDAGSARVGRALDPRMWPASEKGLREVVAADTTVSDIDGEAGRLWYVGYEIADLAEHATFEEVVYLHNGHLPNQDELDGSTSSWSRTGAEPVPHPADVDAAQQTSPMSMLRTSISAASAYDPDGRDESPEAHRKAMRLIAKMPALIAYYERMRTGQEIVPPNLKLPHAANFLYMLSGEEPDHDDADALDTTFILYADHTMNASTFTAHHRLDPLGHVQRDHRCDRGAQRPAARRRQRGGDEDGRGDRRCRRCRGLRP